MFSALRPISVSRLVAVLVAATGLAGCASYGPVRQGEAVRRDLIYAERDGKKLHLDLYLPPQAKESAPLVVWFHDEAALE